MRSIIAKIALVIVFIAVLQLFFVLGFLLWPYDVLGVNAVTIKTPVVIAGNSAVYSVDYCKKLDVQGVVYYEIMDEADVIWDTTKKVAGKAPQCGIADVAVFVPPDIKAGKYKIRVTIHYAVNPIRESSESFETPFFDVLSK